MQRYAVMEDVKGETRGAFETVSGFIDSIDTLMAHGEVSASTTNKGHVQLSSATDSDSEILAATPKAVKAVYDLALEAKQSASDGKSAVANAVTAMGVFASPTDTFPTLAEKIGQINTELQIEVGDTYTIYSGDSKSTISTTYNSVYKCMCNYSGVIRVGFKLQSAYSDTTAYGRIYINGTAVGIERSALGTTVKSFTEDFLVFPGDVIEVYIKSNSSVQSAYISGYNIKSNTKPLIANV